MSGPCRLGLLAVGDSITHGGGEPLLGVQCRPWPLWLARALALPYTNLAVEGACVPDVLDDQLTQVHADYDVACLYIGVNDVRRPAFDAAAFERDYAGALAALRPRAERVLTCTIPLDLGRPRAGAKVGVANDAIRRLSATHDAVCVELGDLRGRPLLLPDAVHPTAVGQLEIADRAARALGAGRLPSDEAPRRRAGLRYARQWSTFVVQDVLRRGRERVRPPR